MAQTPRGGLYGPPSKGHHGVCAIYSESTVLLSNYLHTSPEINFVALAFNLVVV